MHTSKYNLLQWIRWLLQAIALTSFIISFSVFADELPELAKKLASCSEVAYRSGKSTSDDVTSFCQWNALDFYNECLARHFSDIDRKRTCSAAVYRIVGQVGAVFRKEDTDRVESRHGEDKVASTGKSSFIFLPARTRHGLLATSAGGGKLALDGKLLLPPIDSGRATGVEATFEAQGAEILLVHLDNYGNQCPGRFVFVVSFKESARHSPEFGTCYDDEIEVTQTGQVIAFSMRDYGGAGNTRYRFINGKLYRNGVLQEKDETFPNFKIR